MFLLAVLSLFFTEPAPLDMPRASAYLVRENGKTWLEDRYDRLDLWTSRTILGRWADEAGRTFVLARLDWQPPANDYEVTQTRAEATAERVRMPRVRANADFPPGFLGAIELLSPCAVVGTPRSPRQLPRGYKRVYYWQNPTNYEDVVCTFQPERTNAWYLASWTLSEDDDYPHQVAAFEDRFLRRDFPDFLRTYPPIPNPQSSTLNSSHPSAERDLLRADARHSIAAYPNWHSTGAGEFEILDDLPTRGLVETLTNDFPVMRAKYAAAMPSSIDTANVLCVARIYASRDEYLDALERDGLTNMLWSAAYWSPRRRELVAYQSPKDNGRLLRTIRHEAFHQYFSYAMSMIPGSPWLNEGYAEYFEDENSEDWELDIRLTEEELTRLAALVPPLLFMDEEQFYDGTDYERRVKYRLAWSLAVFIEKGADKVRLKPFEGLKRRYVETLLETRDMKKATEEAFRNPDVLKKFVVEWKKFWLKK